MPNRIVRGELLRSERYHEVSESARLLFFEFLLVADDYGLIHLAPIALKMSCPLALTKPYEQVLKLISELADVDLIRVYEVGGARYGYIPRFKNWPQALKPKFPKPTDPASLNEINELIAKRHSGKGVGTQSPQPGNGVSTRETETETESETKERSGASAPSPTRGSRFVDNGLQPNWRDYCLAKRPDLQPEDVYESFRDYWQAKPGKDGVKLDWTATWRLWVRNTNAPKRAIQQRGGWVG